jgi:N-acetylmuramoyl-L-alanine amidase
VIDPGHGGKDPGALGYRRYREKAVTLQIAKELKKILKSRGYKVYMTRERDRFIRLRNRTKYANDKHADIFISIHANAVSKKHANSVHGIESYFLSPSRSSRAKRVAAMENKADLEDLNFYGKQCFLNTINSHNIIAANKLAIDLQRGALATLQKKYKNVKDAGVREGPFWVLVGAQMPAVLVEVGFITHPTEAQRLANRAYQRTMAQGLANGIERYFIHNH